MAFPRGERGAGCFDCLREDGLADWLLIPSSIPAWIAAGSIYPARRLGFSWALPILRVYVCGGGGKNTRRVVQMYRSRTLWDGRACETEARKIGMLACLPLCLPEVPGLAYAARILQVNEPWRLTD